MILRITSSSRTSGQDAPAVNIISIVFPSPLSGNQLIVSMSVFVWISRWRICLEDTNSLASRMK